MNCGDKPERPMAGTRNSIIRRNGSYKVVRKNRRHYALPITFSLLRGRRRFSFNRTNIGSPSVGSADLTNRELRRLSRWLAGHARLEGYGLVRVPIVANKNETQTYEGLRERGSSHVQGDIVLL